MEACESLINLANWRGGPDNITVAVCKVESD
jgi:serine/threonine protein phosphatase PrpC